MDLSIKMTQVAALNAAATAMRDALATTDVQLAAVSLTVLDADLNEFTLVVGACHHGGVSVYPASSC